MITRVTMADDVLSKAAETQSVIVPALDMKDRHVQRRLVSLELFSSDVCE